MRDPFRPEKNTQLIREAQIGLSVVAIMLSLFLYVAFYKIAGRGRHLPEHVRNAPIAETIYADIRPANEVAMTPQRYLEDRKSLDRNPSLSRQVSQARPAFDPDQASIDSNSEKTVPDPGAVQRVASKTNRSEEQSIPVVTNPQKSLVDRFHGFVSGYGQNKAVEDRVTTARNPIADLKSDSSTKAKELPHEFTDSVPPADSTESNVELASGESSSLTESHSFRAGPEPASLRSNPNDIAALPPANPGERTNALFAPLEKQPTGSSDFKPLPKPSVSRPAIDAAQMKTDSKPFDRSPLREPTAAYKSTDSVEPNSQFDAVKSTIRSPQTPAADAPPAEGANGMRLDSETKFNSTINDPALPSIKAPKPIAYQPGQLPVRLPQPRLPIPADNGIVSVSNSLRTARPELQNNNSSLRLDSVHRPVQTLTANNQTEFSPPVQPIAPPSEHPQSHIARAGESFWSIASDIYEDPRFFHALYKVNESVTASFEQLDPGTKLQTPTKAELIRLWPDLCPRDTLESGPEDRLISTAESRFYVTQEGETLFGIAGRVLNQKSRYLEIYHANQIRLDAMSDLSQPLPAGMRLVLPRQ